MKRFKILLVDDFDTMIRIIRNILEDIGYRDVISAKNGEEAWQLLKRQRFDFIISDWNMPKMTGLELLKKAKADPELAHIPFLMVTAEAEKRHIEEAIAAKVDQYIIKPFTSAMLKEKIDQAIRKQKKLLSDQDGVDQ